MAYASQALITMQSFLFKSLASILSSLHKEEYSKYPQSFWFNLYTIGSQWELL